MSPKHWLYLLGGGLGAVFIGSIGWGIGQAVASLIAAHTTMVGLLALAGVVIGLIAAGRYVLALGWQQQAKAQQGAITHLQNGMPVHVRDVPKLLMLAGPTLADYAEVERIRAGVNPALTSYHNHVTSGVPTELLQHLISSPTHQLTSADAAPQLVAADEWRGWIDRAPHLLIAGRTDAGKTTLATALLIDRALAGDAVLVLDPHYQPGKWAGVPTIGGGNNFEAILTTLPYLVHEMTQRFKQFELGRQTEDFQRLTVLIDEVPAVVSACMETTPGGSQKIIDPRWVKFAARLGSEARKVRISVILLTQSLLVKDIQINSQLRDNYLRIGLGDRVPDLLDEVSGRHRAQLHELRIGQTHPAAMEWKGEIHMLDTSDVRALASRSLGERVQIWQPPALASKPSVIPDTAQLAPPTNPEQILGLLEARRTWMTSTQIADALKPMGLKVCRTELTKLFDAHQIERRATPQGVRETYEYRVNQSIKQTAAAA